MNIKTLLTDEETIQIIFQCEGTVIDARKEVNKAQDAKTKRVIVEWLKKHNDFNELGIERLGCGLILTIEDYKEFKKWALGE